MTFSKYYMAAVFIWLFACLLGSHDAIAQKNKSNKRGHDKEMQRTAELYFTEGEKYFMLEDYAKALVYFQKSLETVGGEATVYFKIAQIMSRGNDPQKALENIKKAINLDNNNKHFYVLAAEIYTQLGDFKNAANMYEIMINRIANTDQYLIELAAIYIYQKHYEEALTTYDKIEVAYGVSEEITYQKQKIYLQNSNLQKALLEGQKLIDAYPGEEGFIINQAKILMSNGLESEATAFLMRFLKENPENTRTRLILADLQRKSGDFKNALENLEMAFKDPAFPPAEKIQLLANYRTSLSIDDLEAEGVKLAKILLEVHPNVAEAYTVYADILQTIHNRTDALAAYRTSLTLDNTNFGVWQNVLQLYFEKNNMDSVIILSDQALELFPNQAALYYFNGASNLYKRNYQEAIHSLEQGKRLASANALLVSTFNSMLGDAYNATKEYEKSEIAYDAALAYDPDNYAILNNYSYYLALRGEKLEKAEKMAEKTVRNNPDNITYLDTYAWVLYKSEKYKEAKKVIEKALSTGNATAIYYEHYGDILYRLGNINKAVEQWEIAKKMNPNADLINKKIADKKLYE